MGNQISECDYEFKVLLIGDSLVGKSHLLFGFTKKKDMDPDNFGLHFDAKNIQIDGKTVKGLFWDTPGHERFQEFASLYYKGAAGVMLVYDITEYKTYKNVEFWLKKLQDHADPNIVKLLVGNKSDKQDLRKVSTDEARNFAEKNNMSFIETSYFDKQSVDDAFQKILMEIYQIRTENCICSDTNNNPSTGKENINTRLQSSNIEPEQEHHRVKLEQHRTEQEEHRAEQEHHRVVLEQHRAEQDHHRVELEQHRAKMEQHRTELEQHRAKMEQHRTEQETLLSGETQLPEEVEEFLLDGSAIEVNKEMCVEDYILAA